MSWPTVALTRRERAALLVARLGIDRFDVLQLLGVAVCAWGVGMVYRPAGIIVAGLALITVGVLGDLAKPKGAA